MPPEAPVVICAGRGVCLLLSEDFVKRRCHCLLVLRRRRLPRSAQGFVGCAGRGWHGGGPRDGQQVRLSLLGAGWGPRCPCVSYPARVCLDSRWNPLRPPCCPTFPVFTDVHSIVVFVSSAKHAVTGGRSVCLVLPSGGWRKVLVCHAHDSHILRPSSLVTKLLRLSIDLFSPETGAPVLPASSHQLVCC